MGQYMYDKCGSSEGESSKIHSKIMLLGIAFIWVNTREQYDTTIKTNHTLSVENKYHLLLCHFSWANRFKGEMRVADWLMC